VEYIRIALSSHEERHHYPRRGHGTLGPAAGRKPEQEPVRLVGDLLAERRLLDGRYELAMRDYFSLEPRPLGAPGQRYTTRDELHNRAGLR
jgi:hypothetical protein